MSNSITSRRSLPRIVLAVATAMTALVLSSKPAAAGSFTFTVVSPIGGGIGVDAAYQFGGAGGPYEISPCPSPTQPSLEWNAAGQLVGTTSVPDSQPGLGSLTKVSFELYPGPCGRYDPWATDVGGVHFEASPSVFNLGEIALPVAGQNGAFRIDGDIISATPITEGRVIVDAFQFADAGRPLQNNGTVAYGTFASVASQGEQWTAGAGFAGRYLLFVTDTTTGRKILTLTDIFAGAIPTIDLDAICFGFDICSEEQGGSPSPVPGEFFPISPTRILDTRIGLGITNGPVRTGDGASTSLDPVIRADEAANHELQVTGRFGVPESGVSAVLLNVTGVFAPGPGFLSVIPRPAHRTNVFDDQGSFGTVPNTSNLNLSDENAVPNMVLARVGAGGKIRIYNSFGPTHVIADIAGWFGTAGKHVGGALFEGVVPERLMDTRTGIGGPAQRFADGETRELTVAGVAGIPADAQSVVLNITLDQPDDVGSFVTAFPTGEQPPDASNVNGTLSGARANLSVVKVGAGGKISLRTFRGADVLVDVMGSFGSSGGQVTTVAPVRSVDTRDGTGTEQRPLGAGESRALTLAGRAGVPANATAVIVNLTAVNSTAGGFFTAFPQGAPQPNVSNLNFFLGQTVPNLAMLKLGDAGGIEVFNDRGTTDLLIDVMGYVTT